MAAASEAASTSPVERFLKKIDEATHDELKAMKQIADVAKIIENYCSRRILGYVSGYKIEQLVLPLLGDRITFYVLKGAKDNVSHLSVAVLGGFLYEHPCFDSFRKMALQTNQLRVEDIYDILRAQNVMPAGAALRASDQPDLPFNKESLRTTFSDGHEISPISFGGVSISDGMAIGRAVINNDEKKAGDFEHGILISAYTEAKDDDSIRFANGVVVTTGGVLSHAAIRAREHKKPALILNGAIFKEGGLTFKKFRGEMKKSEAVLSGAPIAYYEFSDYGEEDHTVKEGDLVYIDANKGMFYVIADSKDVKTIKLFDKYEEWKNAPMSVVAKDGRIASLKALIMKIKNDNLLRVIINDIIYNSSISSDELDTILVDFSSAYPAKKIVIDSFLKERASAAIEKFKKSFTLYMEKVNETAGIEQLYLMVDDLMIQSQEIEHLLRLVNGNWSSDFTRDSLRIIVEDTVRIGREKLEYFRKSLKQLKGNYAKDSLLALMRITARMGLAGLEAGADLTGYLQAQLVERHSAVEKQAGRGVIWKEDLKDRYARPIVGGKAAHSGEIETALKVLSDSGQLDFDMDIATPMGFAVQTKEYELWKEAGKPYSLDKMLSHVLTIAYRDLVRMQIESILEYLKSGKDERTSERIKNRLINNFSNIPSLQALEDPALIDYVIGAGKKGYTVQRYKGLGEMNPEQLWETTMNPEKRTLLQVRIEDAVAADEIFTTLMGDQVEPRREFIYKNALYASNLDV